MKIYYFAVVAMILLSGCIEASSHHNKEISEAVPIQKSDDVQKTANTVSSVMTTPPEPVITVKPETKYDRFVSWLKTDETDKHPYILDSSKVYEEQYVCSQFTRDFIRNATSAGFEVYSVELTGAVKGQNAWHMIAAVVLDNDWYFVDPQTDVILNKESMHRAYGFEYAYFGKEVHVGRNDATISMPVYYHPIIGLNGQNFLYLK